MQRTAALGGLMPVEEIAAYVRELRGTIATYRLDSYARGSTSSAARSSNR